MRVKGDLKVPNIIYSMRPQSLTTSSYAFHRCLSTKENIRNIINQGYRIFIRKRGAWHKLSTS